MASCRKNRWRSWAYASTTVLTVAGVWGIAPLDGAESNGAESAYVMRLPRTTLMARPERLPLVASSPTRILPATRPIPVDLSPYFPPAAPEPLPPFAGASIPELGPIVETPAAVEKSPVVPQVYVLRSTATPELDLYVPTVDRQPAPAAEPVPALVVEPVVEPTVETWPEMEPTCPIAEPTRKEEGVRSSERLSERPVARLTTRPRTAAQPAEPDPLSQLTHSTPAPWQDRTTCLPAAEEQAGQGVQRASQRASRGAVYSAKSELETSLAIIAEALDRQAATSAHRDCLRVGLVALEEAGDFTSLQSPQRSSDWAEVLSRHRSRIVTAEEASRLPARELARRYYDYAQDHLAAAVGGSRVAAHAYYGLGKLTAALADSEAKLELVNAPRAMALHQTTLAVDPAHSLAANELGVLLTRVGRVSEAREAFRYALTVGRVPEAWRNLAAVHQRLGEQDLARLAQWEWQRIAAASSPQVAVAANGTMVRWVDKATFEGGGAGVVSPTSVPYASPQTVRQTVPHTALQAPNQTHARW